MTQHFYPKPSHRGLFILLVSGVSLLVFILCTLFTFHLMQRITNTIVPDLSNKSVESARSVLRVKRLKMEIAEYRFDQRIACNHILTQTPLPGQNTQSSQIIKVVVSRGARTLTVPTLSGLTLKSAAERLSKEGLAVGRVTRYYSQEAEKETVLDQHPESGANATRGTNIHLLVSLGPRPLWFVMPNLRGWQSDEAANTLSNLGMELKEIKRETSEDQPNGTVLEQTPRPGTRIKSGDPAGLVVSMQTTALSQSARFVTLQFIVPPLETEVRVKLVVRDDSGLHEIYNAMEKPNAKISIQRTINNESAKLYIYINGKLFEERFI